MLTCEVCSNPAKDKLVLEFVQPVEEPDTQPEVMREELRCCSTCLKTVSIHQSDFLRWMKTGVETNFR